MTTGPVESHAIPQSLAPSIGASVPIPKPNPGEVEGSFMSRCLSALAKADADKPHDQRTAMCMRAWRERDAARESFQEAHVRPAGSLDIPREALPQIPGEQVEAFIAWLREQGVDVRETKAQACTLKPTQAALDTEKVAKFRQGGTAREKRLITSADGYILDGHHRWGAIMADDPEGEVDVMECGQPIADLVETARKFPGAHARDMNDEAAA